MPRMNADRCARVLDALASFEKIENKATDEIGWVALKFSVTRAGAERLINGARAFRRKVEEKSDGQR